MAITSSIARVAEFKGQQSPAVFQKACERIIDTGVDECQKILHAVVLAVQAGKNDSLQKIIATLTSGNARITGAIQQIGGGTLSKAQLSSLESDYRAAKSVSRAQFPPEGVPDAVREATRTVADLCATAHMNAMRLLSALEARAKRKKTAKPKPQPGDADDFDLNVTKPSEKIPDGSTGDLTDEIRGIEKNNVSDSDADFFANIDLGGFDGSDDTTPSGDDLQIDLKPKK